MRRRVSLRGCYHEDLQTAAERAVDEEVRIEEKAVDEAGAKKPQEAVFVVVCG